MGALNALIALISDVFEHILEEKKAVLTRLKAECILEMFCMMREKERRKVEEEHKWTYVVGPVDAIEGTGDDDVDGDKEDRVMYRRANKRDMKNLRKEVEGIIDKKVEDLKSEMNEKFDQINGKFDQIIDLLKQQ